MKRPLVLLLVLPAIACGNGDSDLTVLQGTVEVREVDIAPLAAGRVVRVLVDEGDSVAQGDTIAVLTAPTLDADLDAARARVTAAEATLRDLEAGARAPEIAAAAAEVRAAEAEATRTARDSARSSSLLAAGAIAAREHDLAVTAARSAGARLAAAREAVALLQAGSRPARIAAARAEVAAARAALAAQGARTDEFVLTAPEGGVVMGRFADPGDLLAVGVPVAVVGLMAEPWVRVYVPARVLPMVHPGMEVAIYPPGAGGERAVRRGRATGAGTGRVTSINPQAEYVTRTALTEEERADLLFGVRVAIDGGDTRFKPGLPVVVALRLAADSVP